MEQKDILNRNFILNEIVKSAIITEGQMRELELSEIGKEQFAEANILKGKFKYDDSELELICKIMTNKFENDIYKVQVRGFVAGHNSEFHGTIIILKKK